MNFLRFFALSLFFAVPAFAQQVPSTPLAVNPSGQTGMFPFVLPPLDDSKTATDVSWMNDQPAGAGGFVKTEGEHFVDGSGKPLRFWGVNLNFQGVFPPKEQAPKIAARLAKFGFNAVRIHHFDGNAAPNGIWKPQIIGGNRLKLPREFDADQLDRFDFFMAELIKRGIYLDLNLHVGRKVYTDEGFSQAAALPDKDKGVDLYDPKLIAAQQDFARAILTHVNPYTKKSYADEPGVCAVEMTNEDSLLGMWLDGSFSKIPAFYQAPLRDSWNAWLKKKYSGDAALRASWTEQDNPLLPGDLLAQPYPPNIVNPNAPDARLDIGINSLRRFKLKTESGALADLDIDALGGPTIDGFVRPGLSTLLKNLGNEKWGFQLSRDGLDLQDGQPYTLSFWARADAPRRISVNLWADKQPYQFLGFSGFADLNSEWQQFSFVFRPIQSEANHARLIFNFGNNTGTIALSEIAIQSGGKLSVPDNWTLQSGVPLVDLQTTQVLKARADFAQFLGETESTYVAQMRAFLRDELKVKCPIWNTQAQFGGWGGLWRERLSDAVDVHAYWKHPTFEGAAFSSVGKVENASMTAAPAADPLSGFSYFRLKGKPFVMTEWNSGQPNDFGQESLLMAAAYGAWQDWAGIFLFDYHSNFDYDRDYFKGFFSIDLQPAKMATAPAAAMIFRRPQTAGGGAEEQRSRGESGASTPSPPLPISSAPPLGDATPATRETNLLVPETDIWREVADSNGQPTAALVLPTWREAGATRGAALLGKVYARFGPAAFITADRADSELKNFWISDTRELKWSKTPAVWLFNAPQSKAAIGFFGGYQITLGDWQIKAPAQGNNFRTFALSSLDGLPLDESKRVLLTATGKAENTAMGWNAERNSVGSDWGRGPTVIEGLSATLQLLTSAKNLRVFALTPTGARDSEVPSTLRDGKLIFSISPRFRTVWYEIVAD